MNRDDENRRRVEDVACFVAEQVDAPLADADEESPSSETRTAAHAAMDATRATERPLRWEPARARHTPSSARLSGPLLSAAGLLAALPGTRRAVRSIAQEGLGIRALARLPESFRGDLPDDLRPARARPARRWDAAGLPLPRGVGFSRSSRAYLDAYRAGRARPEEVVDRALDALFALSRRSPPMNVLAACDPDSVRAAAAAAAARFARGADRPLEGVPFLAKDQHDVAGLPTRFGSRYTPPAAETDATLVARLHAAGAIVLGKSVMTEWGASPIGTNVHCSLPRNPYQPAFAAGGSSTGSAVAVALGIGPFATGGDAGGSARVPAAWSGIFGLKPTFGRVSRAGEAALGSLNHAGALGVTAEDLARFLDAVASTPDPRDPCTSWAERPKRSFGARLGDGVRGLRIGIEENEWADCSPAIIALAREALAALEREGARLVPVRIPLARHAPAIGVATIGCEGVAIAGSLDPAETEHMGLDLRLALDVASGVSARQFLDVQRLRAGLRRQVAAALAGVDVLALPVVPVAAPRLPDEAYGEVFSDVALILDICRHAFLANLTGLPAASAPIGLDPYGVPVGMQIVGDAWDEEGVLAVLAHLERIEVARVERPRGAIDLLGAASR